MTLASPSLDAAAPARNEPAAIGGPELTEPDFAKIAEIAYKAAGLAIGAGKSAMVHTRLARRLRALGLPDYAAYCAHLDGPDGANEIGLMISALTTNVSHFFRESHHFDIFRNEVLPPLIQRARAGGRVRIWSAGCSNGQEPYSIVMTMIAAGMPMDRDVRVLGTDIDPNVIAHAREGLYPETMLSGLPDAERDRFFKPVPGRSEQQWQASEALRSAVQFRGLNLLDDWPMRGRFDAIFCRNVVIYFDAATQDRLWHRFADKLQPDAWLFIGHSERLSPTAQPNFQGRGITAYQHADRQTGARPAGGPSSKGN